MVLWAILVAAELQRAHADPKPLGQPPCFPPGENVPEKEAGAWMKAACRAFQVSDDEMLGFVENALRPLVRRFPRAMPFFHYGGRKHLPTQQGPLGLDQGKAYVDYAARSHWRPDESNSEFGGALYTATDPVASMGYSDLSSPLLIRIEVPAGTGFLDLRKEHRTIPLSAGESRFLGCALLAACPGDPHADWCEDGAMRVLKDRGLDVKQLRNSAKWSPVLRKAYASLGVSGIMGGYGLPQYPGCRVNGQEFMGDFILTDPALAVKIDTFSPVLEPRPSPEKRKAYLQILDLFDASVPEMRTVRNNNPDMGYVELEKTYLERQAQGQVEFLAYYKPWSIALRGDPPTADFLALHRQRSRATAKAGRKPQAALFACSPDAKFDAERVPAERVPPKP